MEFEYGATAWWTTEFYLDVQTTFGDSTIFTGVRWENRFRPLKYEHFINPVIYVEYEHKSAADKILKEVEGHDVESDYALSNSILRKEHSNEIETKLILSTTYKDWNFSENTLAAKDLSNAPWEFGYALGFSRPLALKASAKRCSLCAQNFIAGAEMYGWPWVTATALDFTILHTIWRRSWRGICHPTGPCEYPSGFGLNDDSHRFLLRFGISREVSGFGSLIGNFLKGNQ